jgi:hypothetical protein
MDTRGILAELEAERDRLDRAIAALGGLRGGAHSAGARANGTRRGRRRLSAASKKRISAAMKKAWAERKKASKAA